MAELIKTTVDNIIVDTVVVADNALSASSTKPIQNAVVTNALAGKADSEHSHPAASATTLGLVKPDGNTITIDENGVISAHVTTSSIAVYDDLLVLGDWASVENNTLLLGTHGSVSGDTVTVIPPEGVVSRLPVASTSELGCVKIDGSTITIDDDGVISANNSITVDGVTLINNNGVISINSNLLIQDGNGMSF